MKNFPKLMVINDYVEWFETEEECDDYVWELRCEEASGYYAHDEEEEYSDFVERNSSTYAKEYDETLLEHKLFDGELDRRPGIKEFQETYLRAKKIEALEYQIKRHTQKNEGLLIQLESGTKLVRDLIEELNTLC